MPRPAIQEDEAFEKGVAVLQLVAVFVERIRVGLVDDWRKFRQAAENDIRTLPGSRDPEGHKHMELRTALRHFKQSEMQDCRLKGPVSLEIGWSRWPTVPAT